jgi:hypothetical protein
MSAKVELLGYVIVVDIPNNPRPSYDLSLDFWDEIHDHPQIASSKGTIAQGAALITFHQGEQGPEELVEFVKNVVAKYLKE